MSELAAISVDVDDLYLAMSEFFGRPKAGPRTAIRAQVRRVVEVLDRHGARCTWFVPGYILEACPDALDDALGRGDEVACHGHRHVPAYRHDPGSFEEDLGTAVDLIRRCTGVVPVGYRAPGFTLLPVVSWAAPILRRHGFLYSSSVPGLPVGQHRFRTAGPRPFHWPCGLAELPISTQRLWGIRVPVCGSVYARLLPRPLIEAATLRFRRESAGPLFYYLHPFEAFPEDPPCRFPRWDWRSRLYAANRRGFLEKFEWLLSRFASITYASAIPPRPPETAVARRGAGPHRKANFVRPGRLNSA